MPHLNNEVPTWGHTGFAKQTNSYNYKDVLKDIICALMAGTAAEEVSESPRTWLPDQQLGDL
jgi:hypothetical protein